MYGPPVPAGADPTAMPQGPTPVITVTITDLAGNPAAAYMGFCFAMEINEETDHGYKKSITVQTGYKGLEEANTAPDDKRCAILVLVGKRFLVKLDARETDDARLLHRLLDGMKPQQLERAGAAKE